MIQTHMWGWSGHVARRSQTDLTKVVATWKPPERGVLPGRPRDSWMWNKPMEEQLRNTGDRWENAAANRENWRKRGATWAENEQERRRARRRSLLPVDRPILNAFILKRWLCWSDQTFLGRDGQTHPICVDPTHNYTVR